MKTVLRNPWVRFIGLLLVIFLALWILQIIANVLVPFALALIFAYILDPVVDWMEQQLDRGLRRCHVKEPTPKLKRGIAVGALVAAVVVRSASWKTGT